MAIPLPDSALSKEGMAESGQCPELLPLAHVGGNGAVLAGGQETAPCALVSPSARGGPGCWVPLLHVRSLYCLLSHAGAEGETGIPKGTDLT